MDDCTETWISMFQCIVDQKEKVGNGNSDHDGSGKWLDVQEPDISLVSWAVNLSDHLKEAAVTKRISKMVAEI